MGAALEAASGLSMLSAPGDVTELAKLDDAVNELVEGLLDKFFECTRYTRAQVNFWKDLAWHATAPHARDWLATHYTSLEPHEGMTAFVEKRKADYVGLRRRAADPDGSSEFVWGPYCKVCPECAKEREGIFTEQVSYKRETGDDRKMFLYGTGCKSCANTGYQGRTGLYEILHMSDCIRTMVLNGTTASELRAQAVKEGMLPLIGAGMMKVKAGITTPAEVLRNAYAIE